MTTYDVLIVGAGLSGLQAAATLQNSGLNVLVLEKSRGLSGRASTRRWDGLPVDHGAQFFTVRSPEFRQRVQRWQQGGVCHEWARGFHQYDGQNIVEPLGEHHPRYACREGMSSLGKSLAAEHKLALELETKVETVLSEGGLWLVQSADGRKWQARALLITAPSAQAAALLKDVAPVAAAEASRKLFHPCLAVAARLRQTDVFWQGIQCSDDVVSWIGNDTSKRPDLHGDHMIVVVHATPDVSLLRYEQSPESTAALILKSASVICGLDLKRSDYFFHRWRYALPETTATGEGVFVSVSPAPLILAGDAWAGGKIEGAWLAGTEAANICATLL